MRSLREKLGLIRAYYFFQFAFAMLFWTPIFFEFQKQIGMSDGQIFRIQSLYYLAFCFLEVPTGYFADRVGYLASMRLGAFMLIVSHVVAIAEPSFQFQLLHWMLLALARSLVSGASSAYLYEALHRRGLREEYQRIEGRSRAWTLFGRVACFAAVGYLMERSLYFPYWLTLGSAAISLGLSIILPSIEIVGEVHVRPALRTGATILVRSPRMLYMMLLGVVIFVLGRIVTVNLFQPILLEKGVAAKHLGVWMAVLTLGEAFGSMTPQYLKRYGSLFVLTFVLSFALALSLLPIGISGMWGTGAWLVLFSVLCGWAFPIQKQLMNDAITNSEFRATFLSVESIADRAVCAVVAFLIERSVTGAGGSEGHTGLYGQIFFFAGAISIGYLILLIIARDIAKETPAPMG